MFHSRKSHPDIKRTTQKFLDPKKETPGRLRALRTLLDAFDSADSKVFFQGHYSEIYYVFNDVFSVVECNLKQKGHRSQKEDLDGVLYVLEKILILLPELVHKRWQFHSIGRIMLKLLHHGNAIKLRREGVRLFMLWFQCLQANSDELSQIMYASIIPGFPNPVEAIDWSKSTLSKTEAEDIVYVLRGPENEDQLIHTSLSTFHLVDKNNEDWCSREEIQPIFPVATNEKSTSPDKITKFFLDRVLESMSTGVVLSEWADKRSRDHSFAFIFNNFKKFYLPYIFSNWKPKPPLYETHAEIQVPSPTVTAEDMTHDSRMIGPRESVLRWFVAFTVRFKRQNSSEPSSPFLSSTKSLESQLSSSPTSSPGSIPNVDMLRSGSSGSEHLYEASDVIRRVLYSTRENVQLLHEVLRQGFRLPPRNVNTIKQVLLVYQDWIKLQHSEKPIFILEPTPQSLHTHDVTDAPRAIMTGNEDFNPPASPVRTWSYCRAVGDRERERTFTLPSEEVRAGLQANLRLFLLHSAEVFLVPEDFEFLSKQVDVCKRVIHLYRSIVLEVPMEAKTWEQLLLVLLEAAKHLLSREVPGEKARTLCGQLAAGLLQTLFVTWIRANLKVQVSTFLWDKCMDVLSSITHWVEVINEWNTTLQTLTRVMARTVYSLDLEDLPLVRLSEQKRKKRRHQVENKTQFDKDSFTRWSKMGSHGTGSPKVIRDTLEKSTGSSAPVTPNVQRPTADVAGSEVHPPLDAAKKELDPAPGGSSAFYRMRKVPVSGVIKEDAFTEAAGVVAGSATSKEGENAGQFSSSSVLSNDLEESKQESPLANKLLSFQMSDTESTGSGEMSFKAEPEDSINGIKDEDKTDFASTPPMLRQANSSAMARQDTSKTMDWYNLSFDKESNSMPTIHPEAHMGLSRISESSLESKSEGGSRDSLINNDSMTTQAVFGQDDVDIKRDITMNVTDQMDENQGSRLSSALTGQDISDDLTQTSYRSPSPILGDTREELLEVEEAGGLSEEELSVIAGGVREGWGPISSVVLWRRMLGILGNINKIKDPTIHAKVIECLTIIWDMLAKVRLNQGISLDNKFTPSVPELIPPLQYFATWVFEAASLSMPFKFKEGRLLAYQLMTAMTVRRHELPLPQEYLTHFYRLMHIGLTGTDQDVISAIISNCGHFFSLMLPCCTLLILDFIQAANTIFINQNLELPRAEAVTLMGSLLCFPNAFPNMPLHQPGHQTNEYQPTSMGKDIKEKLIVALLRVAKLDPSSTARCIALNSLGVFLVEELVHCKGHPRVQDCICILLQSITFHHKAICNVSVDLIHLLSEYYKELTEYENDLPLKIVEVLCHTLVSLLPGGEAANVHEDHSIIVPVILCLLDWTMVIPVERLLAKKGDENLSLLTRVFQVLQMATANKISQKRRKSLNISTIISGDGRPIRLARVQDDSKANSLLPSPLDCQDSGDDSQENKTPVHFSFPPKAEPVKLTAQAALMHLVNHLGHFPLGAGPSRLDSSISEHEDNPSAPDAEELNQSIFNSPNVQFFILNDSVLVTMIEIQKEMPTNRSVLHDMTTAKTQVRLILRDMSGRHSWDYTLLYGKNDESGKRISFPGLLQGLSVELHPLSSNEAKSPTRKRALKELRAASSPFTPDRLDEALSYIGSTSRECILYPDQSLNEPAPSSHVIDRHMETSVIDSVSQQFESELNYVNDVTDVSLSAAEFRPPSHVDPSSPFQLCRFLISENGIMAWEKRLRVDLLERNERFLRELKNLDKIRCRERHKIAVLYVADGQEDKTSIMNNSAGSQPYEDFVAGLGWEVDLSKHTGFMGGLERNLSTGATAPYYANSTEEVIFHVSTRMPLATDGTGFTKKMRHLGNDEVHIVWSEHSRDYRYGIVNTEFGGVLLVIYPLKNHLFRIHIIKKPQVPHFGPLFDGAIVNRRVLPSLVRATAVNASMATKRALIPMYERCYEERQESIQRIVKNHKHLSMFEEFASRCFSPAPSTSSRPSTPAGEHKSFLRTRTAPSSLLTEQESIRNRSKSTGTSLIGQNSELAVNKDLSALTISLPDELNRVSTGETVTSRQEKKRLSLRWRNKSSSTTLTEITADQNMYPEGLNGEQ